MNNSNLKYAIIGFLGGILATVVAGLFNLSINRQNKLAEEKVLNRKENEFIVSEFSELQLAYNQLKYDFRNDVNCEITSKHYFDLNTPTIKLMGHQKTTQSQKLNLLEIISELDFITKNHCEISKMLMTRKSKPIKVSVDGKEIKGYIFEGNLKKTDSLFAMLDLELLFSKTKVDIEK